MFDTLISILTKLGIDTDIHEIMLEEPDDTKERYQVTNIQRGEEVLLSLGINLGYVDLDSVTITLEAIMNYYENGSKLNQETLVEDFIVMLESNDTDEAVIPEIMSNTLIEDSFSTFLDITTKDGDTLINIPDELIELQKSVTGSLAYLSYKKLLEVKHDTFFKLYDIDKMDIQNLLYVIKVWDVKPYTIIEKYSTNTVPLIEAIVAKQSELDEQSKI